MNVNCFLNKNLLISICVGFLLLSNCVFSQINFKGVVTDADTGLSLPFVNIGFINKGLGTVSDEYGSFAFLFDSAKLSSLDTLRVSFVGYKEYKLPFSSVIDLDMKSNKIKLEPEVVSLNEVVLTSSKRKRRNKTEKMVGYSFVGQYKNGSWEGEGALGGELVTKINVNKKNRQLNAFYFYVLKNTSDSLLLRVNIYDGTTDFPEKKLTSKSIKYTLKTKIGKVGIDLAPFDIVVADDFSIGIELLKVYGNKLNLVVAGDDTPGVSYRRYVSQGEWKRYSQDALTYFVSTTLLEEGNDEDDVLLEEKLTTNYTNEQLLQSIGRNIGVVSGFVFKEGERVQGVQVQNLFSKEVTTTSEDGRYSIKAKSGDELKFSFASLQSELRTVLETTFAINVALKEQVTELEEVTVTSFGKKKRTQEELYRDFDDDIEIIKTSFGIYSKQTSGYSMSIIDESEFGSGASSLGNLLRGKIPGLNMLSTDKLDGSTAIYLRQNATSNPIPAAFEVDGLIVSGFPEFLDVSQIKRIAVLSGLASVAKYGSIGAGGVIIINTKAANSSSKISGSSRKGMAYTQEMDEVVITEEEARRNWPDFLLELYDSQSLIKAQDIYNSYESKYGTNPNFNIDASTYFLEFWGNEVFTEELISKNLNRFSNNVEYFKALAFVLDKNKKYDQSVYLYKQILLLKSNFVESYRDLANAYVKNGQSDRGENLYARYFNLMKEGFFSKQPEALQNVINSEVKTLLDISENELDNSLSNFISEDNVKTRILLEWSDDAAELNFQFISPDKTVNSWSNTQDGELKESLISKGVTSKDFFIYDNQGSWQINADYKGNKSGLATYLKVTISTDYGSEKQKDSIELFRMDIKNVNRKLIQVP
ncbi:TonB-dependent Receptor Plug Domain [Maribacter orientalis]|uniref:TonB-dependent Receptor Plug Domain n=1 Tax=Maribacter orientalis TaxID=228957 RepID=A0A1H7SQ96_9FLAO|nr:carboxypeptidase-like regulatory domain-containing protein [Maribacter orientalis]SEL74589.1 TonB-dependent Receptor Plug Domain [Maribacter orientalis]|tara:strand:- start:1983 stop:4601 length:2619 start_codon:yes stop_codon:yes gene_type:complete